MSTSRLSRSKNPKMSRSTCAIYLKISKKRNLSHFSSALKALMRLDWHGTRTVRGSHLLIIKMRQRRNMRWHRCGASNLGMLLKGLRSGFLKILRILSLLSLDPLSGSNGRDKGFRLIKPSILTKLIKPSTRTNLSSSSHRGTRHSRSTPITSSTSSSRAKRR